MQKQLKTLGVAEAETAVGTQKSDVKTRLLQLENVVWALKKEANSRENNMLESPHS